MAATQQDLSSAPTPVVNGRTKRRSRWPLEFYRSGIGKKWVMAVSGVMLLGYVLFHMLGNLKVYFGAEDLNHYGEWLRELLVPFFPRTVTLWLLRIGLTAAFFLHIHAAYSLTRMNRRATPERYAGGRDYVAANFASRSMRWTGIIVGLYVLFHLADLTWGTANPGYVRGDTYNNLVNSFERWPVAIIYIVANLALGIHIFHGTWSLFQSLGLNNPRFNEWRTTFARGFAALVTVGNLTFPVSVLAGVIEEEPRVREQVQCETGVAPPDLDCAAFEDVEG
ncbi:MAG: succinate dehydrogenase cytochrome b subunit [Acidimicrobiia bacterium]|nr:succinate dehydrogenase cytochrome b subunit [Acidimicrobiia bacterium]